LAKLRQDVASGFANIGCDCCGTSHPKERVDVSFREGIQKCFVVVTPKKGTLDIVGAVQMDETVDDFP
jgi:hypothetical protein